MAWLWLISVGVTDLQFPVWKQDEAGRWLSFRFEIGRAGIRPVHEGLLNMLAHDRLEFPEHMPREIGRDQARDLRLVFDEEGGEFGASVGNERSKQPHHISQHGNEIPNEHEMKLPLYCPKVQPLLPAATKLFGKDARTIVVLNTRRNENWRDSKNEPVASGPLVARFLANTLGLKWLDNQGRVPVTLDANISTWVDVLTDSETVEVPASQNRVTKRLQSMIHAWNGRADVRSGIAVTTTGGMPPLKPIIERIPATCLGQDRVSILEQPEFELEPATRALDYQSRWTEREALRFHCAETLRNGDYVGAYGIARRYDLPWSRRIRNVLGPLLQLPGEALRINGRLISSSELIACQIEVSLGMGDVIGALKYLGSFIDSAIWDLIATDERVQAFRLKCNRDDECLTGAWPVGDPALRHLLERASKGHNRHGVVRLARTWPQWLAMRTGGQTHAESLHRLSHAYRGAPRRLRNRLMHASQAPIKVAEVESCLTTTGLVAGVGKPFGQNFLQVPNVKQLLQGIESEDLGVEIGSQLRKLLNSVVEA